MLRALLALFKPIPPNIGSCPVCGNPLEGTVRSAGCPGGHYAWFADYVRVGDRTWEASAGDMTHSQLVQISNEIETLKEPRRD